MLSDFHGLYPFFISKTAYDVYEDLKEPIMMRNLRRIAVLYKRQQCVVNITRAIQVNPFRRNEIFIEIEAPAGNTRVRSGTQQESINTISDSREHIDCKRSLVP